MLPLSVYSNIVLEYRLMKIETKAWAVSSQVIDQKRIVATWSMVISMAIWTLPCPIVRYLHELSEFNVYYSRMQNVRLTLQEKNKAMLNELDSCMEVIEPSRLKQSSLMAMLARMTDYSVWYL